METKDTYFKKNSDAAKIPEYGTEGSAGADLRSIETVTIHPGETKLVDTGIAVEIRPGYFGMLFPRSGMSVKTSLRLANSVGVIDSDYRGSIKAAFTNIGSSSCEVCAGDKIAQLVIVPYMRANFVELATLDETLRGDGGFGSTGR